MPRARSETPSAPRWGLPLESYTDVSFFKGEFRISIFYFFIYNCCIWSNCSVIVFLYVLLPYESFLLTFSKYYKFSFILFKIYF